MLQQHKPASIKTAVMCDKADRRVNGKSADYVGFCIPDEFAVGYGLDYAGNYRNLPYIGVLKPCVYARTWFYRLMVVEFPHLYYNKKMTLL